MIFKFYFRINEGNYLECKNSNLNELTSIIKQSNSEETAAVFKIQILDLTEGKSLENLKLYLTEASSLGVYEHLITSPLDTQVGNVLSFEDDTGLFVCPGIAGGSFIKFNINSNEVNIQEEGVTLNEGDIVYFRLYFKPSNQQENDRLFIGLDAKGDEVNATQ